MFHEGISSGVFRNTTLYNRPVVALNSLYSGLSRYVVSMQASLSKIRTVSEVVI